jgi:hypothetical protein
VVQRLNFAQQQVEQIPDDLLRLPRVGTVSQIQVLLRPRHHHRDLAADVQLPEVVLPAAKSKKEIPSRCNYNYIKR